MVGLKFRGALLLAVALVALTAAQAEACGSCNRWFGGGPTTTFYAPYTAAYTPYTAGYAPYAAAYAPPVPQVVNYVPQTYYRTMYVARPVVAYSPVAGCNACGGATTALRPVTSMVTQPQLIPYTTFQPVVVANYAPFAPACATVAPATTTYYAPPVSIAPAPSCCAATSAPVTTYAQYPQSAATISAPAGAPGSVVRSLAPTLATPVAPLQPVSPANQPPANTDTTAPRQQTFEDVAPVDEQPQSRIVLPPRTNATGMPRALDPEAAEDHTTSAPARDAWAVRTASRATPPAKPAKKLDDGGWRRASH